MNKIKLLHIVYSFELGGIETLLLSLLNGLDKDKFEIHLITLTNDKLKLISSLDDNVIVHSLDYIPKQLKSFFGLYNGLKDLIKLLQLIKPYIVHSHFYYAPLLLTSLAILFSNKNILHFRTVHTSGLFYENQKTLLNKFRLIIEKISTKINKTYMIGISKVVHSNNMKYFTNSANDFKLIYNGIDLKKFDKKNYNYSKTDFGLKESDIVISYVARLDNGKNHQFLIDIWEDIKRKIPNAKLCFAGDGVLKEELLEEVEKKDSKDSIIFLGSISNVAELLSVSDLAVFPSSFEGFGLVLLEKFAMSVPVVASDIKAFKEIGNDGENCFLVSLQDKDLYKKRLIELCKYKELRVKMGDSARQRAIEFDIYKCIDSHEEYYKKGLND